MIRIRRILAALAALAGALLAFTAASPAAFADHVPPPGGRSGAVSGVARTVPWLKTSAVTTPPQAHTVVVGMPGWQIALIAAGAPPEPDRSTAGTAGLGGCAPHRCAGGRSPHGSRFPRCPLAGGAW